MATSTNPQHDDAPRIRPGEDIPRLEPWLVVSFLSLIPAGLAIVFPVVAIAGWIATGILLFAGIAMFARDAMKNR